MISTSNQKEISRNINSSNPELKSQLYVPTDVHTIPNVVNCVNVCIAMSLHMIELLDNVTTAEVIL